jgi:hypothetical protein
MNIVNFISTHKKPIFITRAVIEISCVMGGICADMYMRGYNKACRDIQTFAKNEIKRIKGERDEQR